MGLLVDRQFEQCDICGGRVQVDTTSSPGESEDAPAKLDESRTHVGSCTPKPSDEVVPDNSNVQAP